MFKLCREAQAFNFIRERMIYPVPYGGKRWTIPRDSVDAVNFGNLHPSRGVFDDPVEVVLAYREWLEEAERRSNG